jgi:hypothetical protein
MARPFGMMLGGEAAGIGFSKVNRCLQETSLLYRHRALDFGLRKGPAVSSYTSPIFSRLMR